MNPSRIDPDAPNDSGGVPESAHPADVDLSALLDRVIRLTLESPDASESVDEADLDALREVAMRHRGEPFAVSPIGVELVQAILTSYFATWSAPAESWLGPARTIARSLCDDPTARKRTERLWDCLGKATP